MGATSWVRNQTRERAPCLFGVRVGLAAGPGVPMGRLREPFHGPGAIASAPERLLQWLARLESRSSGRRDVQRLAGVRVAPRSCLALTRLEGTEAADRH